MLSAVQSLLSAVQNLLSAMQRCYRRCRGAIGGTEPALGGADLLSAVMYGKTTVSATIPIACDVIDRTHVCMSVSGQGNGGLVGEQKCMVVILGKAKISVVQ